MVARKSLLYYAPLLHTFEDMHASVERISWLEAERSGYTYRWHGRGLELDIDVVRDTRVAVERTRVHYYDLVLIDCRHLPGELGDAARQEAALLHFLDLLGSERDREQRYPFERVVVLVGDPDEQRVDQLLFDLGQRHVGACLRDMSLSPALVMDAAGPARDRFVERLWQHCTSTGRARKTGKKAICCAGGGITGIYYELGVLKCLHDSFRNFDVRDFDMYFGISAGAIVSGLIANGVSIEEAIDIVAGNDEDMQVEIGLRNVNVHELPGRLLSLRHHLRAYARRVLDGEERFSAASLFMQLSRLMGPFFRAHRAEAQLAKLLTRPGMSNDFRRLKRKLYIGATDQDLREHVLFGDEGLEHVPISKAIQASSSIHPFFSSTEIDGRHYTDGFITRTSNVTAAIEKGADLVFVVDPFLPLISEAPGFNAAHSALWVLVQDFKTIAFTRFAQVSEQLLRQNPNVNCYSFLPSNRMRQLMATVPFSTANFDLIVTEAYRSTYRRLRSLEHRLGPDLEDHGIELDLDRAASTVGRMQAKRTHQAAALFA